MIVRQVGSDVVLIGLVLAVIVVGGLWGLGLLGRSDMLMHSVAVPAKIVARPTTGRCGPDLLSASRGLLRARGYDCASVTKCFPHDTGLGVSITCDGARQYNLIDGGGNITITGRALKPGN